MIKRLASLFLVGVFLITTGCGGSAPASPTALSPAANSTPAASAKATPGAAQASAPTAAAGKSAGKPESVAIPSGAAKLDGIKALRIGDVVELPASGLVIQVTGARTSDDDPQNDWVLADVIIGNKGKEKQSISSVMSFNVVTSDWKWYGLDLGSAIAKITADVESGKEPALFDADVEPGQAVKGTARVAVPKSASNLALVFQSSNVIALPNEVKDPYVFVSLGLRGDWSGVGVPDDAPEFQAGTVYKVGDAFKLPKSGLVVKVNSAWERTESIKSLPIQQDQKYVLVDVSVKQSPESYKAWPFEPRSDTRIVTADGKDSAEVEAGMAIAAGADNTRYFSSAFGRGVVGARMAASAGGIQLKIAPSGPGKGEQVLVDLGLGGGSAGASTSAKATPATSPSAVAKASPTAKAAPTPTPEQTTLPDELASFPTPSGFAVVPGSMSREAIGGVFSVAEANWKGSLGVDDVVTFYKQALTKDYALLDTVEEDNMINLSFKNANDPSLLLYMSVWDDGGDTMIGVQLQKD